MLIIRFSVICLAVFCFAVITAQAYENHQDAEKHLESLLPAKAQWALVAVDMQTGENIADFGNSREGQLVPASLMKLFTTGAVFDYIEHGGVIVKTVNVGRKVVRKGRRRKWKTVQRTVEIRNQEQICGLLRDMNVHSRNYVAQGLADYLGERYFGPPVTRFKGARAVSDFLNTLDLPSGEAVIADGCGLLRRNRVTARFMSHYLREVAKKPWFDRFRETLPRPGFEGTVRRIGFTDQRFRVKTGHLNDVFALAGYGIDANGRDFSFAFMVNVRNGRAIDRNHSMARIMSLLADGTLQQNGATQPHKSNDIYLKEEKETEARGIKLIAYP